jgi:hypothetical protein
MSRDASGWLETAPGQKLAVAGGMAMGVVRRLGNAYRVVIADRDGAHHEGHDAFDVVCNGDVSDAVARLAAAGGDRAIAHVVGYGRAWAMPEGEPPGLSVPPNAPLGSPDPAPSFRQERLIADKVVEIIEVMIGIFDA